MLISFSFYTLVQIVKELIFRRWLALTSAALINRQTRTSLWIRALKLVEVNVTTPWRGDLPPKFLVEVNGIEPMTSCVQGRRSPS